MLLPGFPKLLLDMAYIKLGINIACWVKWKRVICSESGHPMPTDVSKDERNQSIITQSFQSGLLHYYIQFAQWIKFICVIFTMVPHV